MTNISTMQPFARGDIFAGATVAISIASLFSQQAKRRMASNVRRLTRNEDASLDALAGFTLDKGSYPWDVI